MEMLKKLSLAVLAVCIFPGISQAELPRDAKMYIQPFDQFEIYLGAAFSKKHVPVVLVGTPEEADLKLSILSNGHQITGIQVEGREKEILWTYLFPKPVESELKPAEKCAVQLRHQFPLSPEALARREQQREAAEAATQEANSEPVAICYGNYVLRPGTYLSFPFQITGAMTVQGHFEAAGGTGNDIQVVIGPRAEVLNWLNGHGGAVSYASEKVTSGDVNVPLPAAGDYLLAFSNTFSAMSAKSVAANFQVTGN